VKWGLLEIFGVLFLGIFGVFFWMFLALFSNQIGKSWEIMGRHN